jgi:sugar lactone lactonase YvrE
LYISDVGNNVIRKVTMSSGIITTIAGNGTQSFSGDGGAATAAELNQPSGVAVDASGNLYISDAYNQRIRMVTASTGIINTIAGNGTSGFSNGTPATSFELSYPSGIAVDGSGNIYVADYDNSLIRKISGTTISTFAGGGGSLGDGGAATNAELEYATGVAADGSGNVYIADRDNQRIRMVNTSGTITTIAGCCSGSGSYSGDGAAATAANLNNPVGVAVYAGNVYISDNGNYRVRKFTVGGNISTFAGNGTQGTIGDGGAANSAGCELNSPFGVAVDASGNVFIPEYFRVREVCH